MSIRLAYGLVAVVLLLGCLAVFTANDVDAQLHMDPNPGGGSGGCDGYLCDYCCEENCDCGAAPPGYYFAGWCSCSSIGCERVCSFRPLNGG